MALAFTEKTAADSTAISTSTPATPAFAITAGATSIFSIMYRVGANPTPTITSLVQSGATWVLVDAKQAGTSGTRIGISTYVCYSAGGVASAVLTINLSTTTADIAWTVTEVTGQNPGANLTDFIRQSHFDGGGDSTVTTTTSTLGSAYHHADNRPYAFFAKASASTTGLTNPSGWSQLQTLTANSNTIARTYTKSSQDSAATIAWTTAAKAASCILEIRAATDTDATTCSVTTNPAGAVSASVFTTQPVIQLRDGSGNAISQSGVTVVPTIATGSGTLGGTETAGVVTNGSGVATFTNLKITGYGNHSLTFTPTSLTAATSSTFFVSGAGPVTKVVISQQPQAALVSAVTMSPSVTVQLQNASSQNVYTASTDIALAVATGAGTLSGITPEATDATGLSTFTGMKITLTSQADTFTLTASSSGITSATTTSILVYPASGGAVPLTGDGGLATIG